MTDTDTSAGTQVSGRTFVRGIYLCAEGAPVYFDGDRFWAYGNDAGMEPVDGTRSGHTYIGVELVGDLIWREDPNNPAW